MRFVITSGGTAGHIYPAQAVAAHLLDLGHDVVFAGTPNGMESRLIKNAGLKYVAFEARGFNRSKPLSLIGSTALIAKSTTKALAWLSEYQPNAVAAFGGYVSIPVGRAAFKSGIPLLVHEQNPTAGWANKYLAGHANAVALTHAGAQDGLNLGRQTLVQVTGNPVRKEFIDLLDPSTKARTRADFRKQFGIPEDALVLLVFGGSQGARHINTAVVALAQKLLERPNLQIIQVTGAKEYDSVKQDLAEQCSQNNLGLYRWHLLDYCDQMPSAYAAADLVLSRSGATTLAEISTLGLPALFVPYPHAAADEQTIIAREMTDLGAAAMVLDSQLDSEVFAHTLLELLDNPELRAKMTKAAKSHTTENATEAVVKLLLQIANI